MKAARRFLFHPLVVLALVLVSSAAFRFDGIQPVFATTGQTDRAIAAADGDLTCAGLPELELMYRTLGEERATLRSRAEGITQQEAELDEVRTLMRESFEELQLLQAELNAERDAFELDRNRVVEAAESDLDRLVSVYEAMKPKDAAGLFETMDPQFAAGFLNRMQPQLAAQVLSGVSPEFAYAVSVLIAGRNVGVAGDDP